MRSPELEYPVDEYVRGLDPLNFDRRLPGLWGMNSDADSRRLVVMLRELCPSAAEVSALCPEGCLAAMRDLGLVMGSVRRHGVEPLDAVPELGSVITTLGSRTGMVPRDTVHHYIRWNPAGRRERMYTGHRMERLLISSVRVSLPRMTAAVDVCRRLWELPPDELSFAAAANELVTLLRSMEDSIDVAIANVSPEFFARTMRPYFEDIRVGDRRYLGPAAAHVPVALVDLALWASDHGSRGYTEFAAESAWYGVPGWRELHHRWVRGPSLVSRVMAAVEQAGGMPPRHVRAGMEALARALRSLVAFRGKHVTIARKAYAHDLRLYPLGSGGGSIQLLTDVVALTKQNAALVRRSLDGEKRSIRCES